MKQTSNGRVTAPSANDSDPQTAAPAEESPVRLARAPSDTTARRSVVAKVSHTLTVALAERLEEFAFFQRMSESAVIEHTLNAFFAQSSDDAELGDILRREGAGRRRKT
jgi:hypothetical protein